MNNVLSIVENYFQRVTIATLRPIYCFDRNRWKIELDQLRSDFKTQSSTTPHVFYTFNKIKCIFKIFLCFARKSNNKIRR